MKAELRALTVIDHVTDHVPQESIDKVVKNCTPIQSLYKNSEGVLSITGDSRSLESSALCRLL